jgi:hypothetical protein
VRIAALNDIEGNLAALEAVLAEMEEVGTDCALVGQTVELRRTTYDVEAAVASIRSAGALVDEEELGQLLEPPDGEETTANFEAARARISGA